MHHVENIIQASLVIVASLLVSNCAVTSLAPDNDPVRVIFHNELSGLSRTNLSDCDFLGTLISSEGRWYNSIFISNAELSRGSLNNMKNEANQLGANMVYIDNNIDFETSVTFLGQAYHCDVINN
jgi:hypothetical protein